MMEYKAYAKINWSLAITGTRPDGYHTLDMLMQTVTLCDRIQIEPSHLLTCTIAGNDQVPADDTNLVMKAAAALRERFRVAEGARMHIEKNIPAGAGLGGGSADAAAALRGLAKLWKLTIKEETLADIGGKLGADVPFCLQGGLARVSGIGEKISPLGAGHALPLVIIWPDAGLSTPAVFRAYDAQTIKQTNPCIDAVQQALQQKNLPSLAVSMGNALEEVAVSLLPEIAACTDALMRKGAVRAMMTGSGSAVFGLFDSDEKAERAARDCAQLWKHTCLTHTRSA